MWILFLITVWACAVDALILTTPLASLELYPQLP